MKVPEPRKLPSGMWFIQLRLAGESVPVTALTAKECKDAAALIKAEHLNGKRRQKVSSASMTLKDGINDYISSRNNALSPSTVRGYEIIKEHRFQGVMDKKLKSIKSWQAIVNTEAKSVSPKTLKNAWFLVASVLKYEGYPVPNVKLPSTPPKEKAYLEPDMIPKFVGAVKGQRCEIEALLALSSLRCSEICALTWDNVDLGNRRILVAGAAVTDKNNKVVLKETNKNASSHRYVPILMDELFDALNAVEDKTGYVVSVKPNTIYRRINKVCEDNGLPLVGVHGLRHSFASLAYHLGMPEKIAMQIGGWSDYDTMRKIYTHLSQKDVSKYAGEMKQFYRNANENANSKEDVQ